MRVLWQGTWLGWPTSFRLHPSVAVSTSSCDRGGSFEVGRSGTKRQPHPASGHKAMYARRCEDSEDCALAVGRRPPS